MGITKLSIAIFLVFATSAYAQTPNLKSIYDISTNRTVGIIRDGNIDYKVDVFRGEHWAGESNDLVLQISSPPTRFDLPPSDQQTRKNGLASDIEVNVKSNFENKDVKARLCCREDAPQVETSWRHFGTCLNSGCLPSLYLIVIKEHSKLQECPILISIGNSTFKIGTESQEHPEMVSMSATC